MSEADSPGWKNLVKANPWFSGKNRYPIPAYSEFMPPVRLGRSPYDDFRDLVFAEDDLFGWYASEVEEELQLIQKHPGIEEHILLPIADDEELLRLVRGHHEHYDGTGYPDGLQGGQIPLGARILAVADAYEAMTSERPYRKKLSEQKAIAELEHNRGIQFDPEVVDTFFRSNILLCLSSGKSAK